MSGFADDVTPVIIARDEQPNILRTLHQLTWANDVVVVDSGSTDETVAIARGVGNVRVFHRDIDTLAAQWTFTVAQAQTPWVLTLDADYFVPAEFEREIASLAPRDDVAGYEAEFIYAIGGKPLRASLYTPRAVLLRRDRCEFYMDGHTQRVRVSGGIERLKTKLIHDDRKPLRRFIARQKRYMRDEAEKLRTADPRTLNTAARIRKLRVIAPFIVPFYVLFVRGVIFDGIAGLHYTFERTIAEWILALELTRRGGRPRPPTRREPH